MAATTIWSANTPDALTWDRLTLGGITLPGIAEVSMTMTWLWDTAKPNGADGGGKTYRGRENRVFDVTLSMITQAELDAYAGVVSQLNAKAGGKSVQPLEILHPLATLHSVQSVVVDSLQFPAPSAAQPLQIKLKLSEWVAPAPSKTSSTSKKSTPTAGQTGFAPAPDPVVAQRTKRETDGANNLLKKYAKK